MRAGYASVIRDPRASVHGVLWDLALSDVRALDVFEEVDRGLYAKIVQPVLREPVGSARALVYVGRSQEPGTPREDYFARVLSAARHWELPAPYLAYLEALGGVKKERAQ